jgi:hypothetical protein
VQNDPVNFGDPSGLKLQDCVGGTCGSGSGGYGGIGLYDAWTVEGWSTFLGAVWFGNLGGSGAGSSSGSGAGPSSNALSPAIAALSAVAGGGFKSNAPCREFFSALIEQNGIDANADSLMDQVAAIAGEISSGGYVYDGPSSTTELTEDKFPTTASPGVSTVGQWFAANNGALALSQHNGLAVFFRSSSWSRTGPLVDWLTGRPSQYGLGTALHEILHKKSISGGFSHSQIDAALSAAGMRSGDYGLGRNRESDQLGRLCF